MHCGNVANMPYSSYIIYNNHKQTHCISEYFHLFNLERRYHYITRNYDQTITFVNRICCTTINLYGGGRLLCLFQSPLGVKTVNNEYVS